MQVERGWMRNGESYKNAEWGPNKFNSYVYKAYLDAICPERKISFRADKAARFRFHYEDPLRWGGLGGESADAFGARYTSFHYVYCFHPFPTLSSARETRKGLLHFLRAQLIKQLFSFFFFAIGIISGVAFWYCITYFELLRPNVAHMSTLRVA